MAAQVEPDKDGVVASKILRRPNSLGDNLRFLKAWLRRPADVGAVLPSSKGLAHAMAKQIDPASPGTVVEFGGGTGSVTGALLERGIAPNDLAVIEKGADFVAILRARFPKVPVIYGDARYAESLLNEVQVAPAKAVISSLPLLSLPRCERHEILAQAFMLLQPGGVMVQFTYGPASPIDSGLAYRLDIVGERAEWILGNVPPASIWRYQQSHLNTFNPE